MLVLSVTECPNALRGDLTKWLLEIDTGVYVGNVGQRVREKLWQRVISHLKTGRAIMVYSARNEQRMDFRIHNTTWEPIDFDGLKLMLRPHAATQHKGQLDRAQPEGPGYSIAAKMQTAKRVAKARLRASDLPDRIIVFDLETSGLDPLRHEIVELAAIRVVHGQEEACFQSLIIPQEPLKGAITSLTGLTEELLRAEGRFLPDALQEFLAFLEDLPLVAHNIPFDLDFLQRACVACGLPLPANQRIDTLSLSRHLVPDAPSYQLASLMKHFDLPHPQAHRSLPDCRAVLLLLHKLMEIRATRQ